MQYAEPVDGLSLSAIRSIEQNPDHKVQIHLAARMYANLGWYVVPLVKDGKALPRRQYGVSYSQASRSLKVIDKWFNPQNGKFAGWNVGIACGREGGVFAIDVDRHGDVDGFATLAKLEKKYSELPPGPVQETPGGGKHYLFMWQENAACTTSKIGPGVDTRGGTETACKGHIVAWPSRVDGGEYRWSSGGPLPPVPEWIAQRLGVAWRPPAYSQRGSENVGDDDIEAPLDRPQIERMLAAIPIDDISYNEWLKLGMSIKSQLPNDEGLEVWDEWSQTGNRHKRGECQIRWQNLNPNFAVRAGTLFYIAKKYGWEPDPIEGDKNGNRFDELVAKMNEEFAITILGGKIRIIREKEPDIVTGMHYDLMDPGAFKILLQNERTMVVDENGKSKYVSIADVWLGHQDRRTYPNGMGLYPDGAPHGYYNTWRGFAVEPRHGTCTLFNGHIQHIVCGGDERVYEWVMDWLADLVQDPANPKGTAIVMRGKEGTGKGTFANAICDLFGPHARHIIDESHLTSNFNAHLLDSVVVFADEVTWGGNKKTAGKLKGMVTERHLIAERKGVDAVTYRNMIHMLVASNDDWVIPAGTSSRRWLVLDVLPDRANDREYFKAIRDELDNGGLEAFLYELLQRKVTNNLAKAPVTEALENQRKLSLTATYDSVVLWLADRINEGNMGVPSLMAEDDDDWPLEMASADLYDSYLKWCEKMNVGNPLHNSSFSQKFKTLVKSTHTKKKINGKSTRVVRVPPLELVRRNFELEYGILLEENDDSET